MRRTDSARGKMGSVSGQARTTVEPEPPEPDYRFTLANERTFLAYLRTALALDAAGLAAVQFLTDLQVEWARRAVGVILVTAGILASVGAYRRWRANQRAIRAGAGLPPTLMPFGLAAAVLVVSAAAVYLVVAG